MRAACAIVLMLCGCGSRGAVTFTVREPVYGPLNPISDLVTEYSIKRMDGSLLAVASQTAESAERLPLGPLASSTAPFDLQVSVLSGSNLLGLARLKDVSIQPAVQREYVVEVRKPLITIGSDLPALDTQIAAPLRPGQIIDPLNGQDLAKMADGPRLPPRTTAASATWDGRYLLAAGDRGLNVIDTGSGKTIGSTPLPFFGATRIIVGVRDSAVAVMDPTGSLQIYRDVSALTAFPDDAESVNVDLGGPVRTAAFSPDGKHIYALTGKQDDPCSPTSAIPAANALLAVGIDGTMEGTWTFDDFISDIAIDASDGRVIVADVNANRVATFDSRSDFGTVTPTKLVDATCPTAVRTAAGDVVVVTNEKDTTVKPAKFVVQRVSLRTGAATKLPLESPIYENVVLPDMPTPNTRLSFQFTPVSLVAYQMAITPDATRAVFATRARYRESNASLTVFLNPCKATYEVTEFGVYELDLRTGQATYTSRSQWVAGAGNRFDCIICDVGIGTLPFTCESTAGDRAAGISTVFGGF
jgi:hypothetical protein